MTYNKQKVEDAVLALLQLTARDGFEGTMVAWKNLPGMSPMHSTRMDSSAIPATRTSRSY
jgi:hypothetical protein